MRLKRIALAVLCGAALVVTGAPLASALPQAAAAAPATRQLGTVKVISGNSITLTTDAGADVAIVVPEGAKMICTAPGQKDLTGATAITLPEIQVGDRMLVRGKPSDDAKSFTASSVIVMKKADISEKQAREKEDWQKRGIGGPVTAVDATAATVTISSSAPGGSKPVAIHTTKATVIRRYSSDSVKFDDAKPATLEEIKVGDQLRARGTRSADGTELAAEEIVAGTFRNIAGLVVSTDAQNNSVTVNDLATKKPVIIKITADSQVRNLPPTMAQMIAMRLKGGAAGANGNGNGNGAAAGSHGPASGAGQAGAVNSHAGPGNGNGNGRGDFNQMLGHLPSVTVAELKKGDAVMIVTTQGNGAEVTAITMLSGVEPILTAQPNGNGSMILSAWNLSAGGEGGGEGPAQ